MSNRYVVAYDGSESARRAVDHAIERAKQSGASIVLTHVLEWSPYSFLTPEEIEERHKRRREEMERARTAVVQPIVEHLTKSKLEVTVEIRYGNITETLIALAKEVDAAQIIIGRTGQSTAIARLFGSVAGALAQISPVPVTIVP